MDDKKSEDEGKSSSSPKRKRLEHKEDMMMSPNNNAKRMTRDSLKAHAIISSKVLKRFCNSLKKSFFALPFECIAKKHVLTFDFLSICPTSPLSVFFSPLQLPICLFVCWGESTAITSERRCESAHGCN